MIEPFNTLLSAATMAPSGDNTQPWRFIIDEASTAIGVCVDTSRDPSPMNAGQSMSRVACGAAIENIVRTAHHNGWNADITPPESPDEIARVFISGQFDQPPTIDSAIVQRHTNRNLYQGSASSVAELQELQQALCADHGAARNFQFCTDGNLLKQLGDLIGQADRLMFGMPDYLRAFLQNVRKQPARDGLPYSTLGLSALEQKSLGYLPKLPDWILCSRPLLRGFQQKARKSIRSSAGLIVLFCDDYSPDADVALGRQLQRAWLKLTEKNLAVQPMMSLPVLQGAAAHGELTGDVAEKTQQLDDRARRLLCSDSSARIGAILRFGQATEAAGRTSRRPISACTTEITEPSALASCTGDLP